MALVLVCIVGARSLRLKLAWAISRPQPHKRASPLWVQLRVVPNLVNGLMTSVIASLIDLDWIPHERALWNSPKGHRWEYTAGTISHILGELGRSDCLPQPPV